MSNESNTCRAPESETTEDGGVSTETTSRAAEAPAQDRPGAPPTVAAGGALLLAGITLAAANMRPAVTSLASILGEVRDSVGASSAWASVVTAVPTFCFGLAGIAAPLLARRWGINRVVGVSLIVLTVAMLGRVLDGPWSVFGGTLLVCAAIAMCNVLIPVVVKEFFPSRVGMATGLYTTSMAAGGALGSTFTPWLDSATGSWRISLATWAVVALAASCTWMPATRRLGAGSREAGGSASGTDRSLRRSPLAWAVTGFFGLQALVAYVVMGWLPEVFKGAGVDATTSGALLGVVLVVGVPINLVLPLIVTRTRSQSGWAVGLAVLAISGLLGLLLAPLSAPIAWALLLGVGISAFPLALVIISLRTRDAAETGQLSAMSQSIGYLVASAGPLLFGVLHDMTSGWSASLVAVMVVLVVQAVLGVFAGRPKTV